MKEEFISLRDHIERLQFQGVYWFVRDETIEILQISYNSFKKATSLLAQKNKLKHVRGDFYLIVPPEYRATQSLPATWFIDAFMTHLKQPYYASLLTAASLHGAAHQQSMAFQVITNKRTRNITIGQVHIEFTYKKNVRAHYYQPVKTATGRMNVATAEMTALDLLSYMEKAGQINSIATVLCELVEKLDTQSIIKLLKAKDAPLTSAQRLGYLINHLKLPLNVDPLAKLIKTKKPSRRLLVPGSTEPVIAYDPKWYIEANENVEPDDL